MRPQLAPLPSSGRRPRRHAPARLTRRGRALVIVLVAALLLLAFSLGRVSLSASTAPPPRPVRPALRSVVVQPGDTLWEIAAAAAPSADPRVTVERIIDRNGLSGPVVRPGQSLVLPRAP